VIQPTLYLFIGYPGAGKSTVAKLIAEQTGAHLICADNERHKLFKIPTHAKEESKELYEKLNEATEYLLSQGRSVVFDTNFNFLSDRKKLRDIADKYNATTVLIWIKTPLSVALKRAVHSHTLRNNYDYVMTSKQFNDIATKLEPPKESEKAVIVDGSDLDKDILFKSLAIKD
jgi:predicted kinase